MTALQHRLAPLKAHLPLLIGLLLSAPVLFFQAFRYSFPLGYAGMFTLMSELIARENFALPLSIPHYGPGGIPFVYPPLALYLFALALKLGISSWAYLRLIPAIFSLLALVPLYFLTRELSRSKAAGLAAMLLAITSPAVYYTHVWSAGVVRGLALGLCLAGLYFYIRALRADTWRNRLLAGLCLGLLLTTHLLYVAFAALVGIAFLIGEWKPARLLTALIILGLALLVASPWLGLIIARHGLASLLVATSSHRNVDFLSLLAEGPAALQFIWGNLEFVLNNWFVTALALPGCLLLLYRKQFHLPLAFGLVLSMGEASFYAELLAAIVAGIFCAEMFERATRLTAQPGFSPAKFGGILLAALILLGVGGSCGRGIIQIAQYSPEIDVYSLEMAKFVKREASPTATYLYIGKINEAEWFPYLLDRDPVLALWGSEWKGTYAAQLQALVDLRECQAQKSWVCLEALMQKQQVDPDLLIGPNQRWLMLQVKETHAWQVIYSDERYLVWEKAK